MKKVCFLLLLLSFSACKHGIQSVINNKKTGQHVNIPGTRLYVVMPPDAKIGEGFVGLQMGDSAAMVVHDLPGKSFAANNAIFTKEGFEQKGLKVLDYKEIKVNGCSAKYIAVQQGEELKGYAVLFGDSTFSTMVMTTYPKNNEQRGKEILAALNSMYYDRDKKMDPFETALFSIDEKDSKFRFYNYEGGLYTYTPDGKAIPKDGDSPYILMAQMPINDSMALDKFAEILVAGAQEYGFTGTEVRNNHWENINGHNAYETEVYDEKSEQRSLLYVCILERNGSSVFIECFAKKDPVPQLEEFKKFARALHLK
jgi:hypothetical protein